MHSMHLLQTKMSALQESKGPKTMFRSWSTNWNDSLCSIHIHTLPVLRLGTLHLEASRLLWSQLKHMVKTISMSSRRLGYESEVVFNVRLVEYKRDPKQKGKTINADKVVFVAGSHFCGFPSRCPSNVNTYTCTNRDRLFIID